MQQIKIMACMDDEPYDDFTRRVNIASYDIEAIIIEVTMDTSVKPPILIAVLSY